ncbi:MAG: amidohydrolase family protein [Alphaproteobacteria bacterium]
MATYDLVLRGGTIVDGTGAPGYRGDLALADGRVAAVGKVDGEGRRTIDAGGLVVSPGFVDIHSHYDAQAVWDPLLSSSAEHGVTTVVTGNCGIGVAPCRPADRDITMQDLVSLEGIEFDTLQAGLDWAWESFPDFIRRLDRRGTGVNIAPLVPLATLRRYVMGEAAIERGATAEEAAAAAGLLRQAMEAGAHGFSTTTVMRQKGYRGNPLACQLASREELAAYARVLRDLGRGVIQGNVTDQLSSLSDDEYDLLDMLQTESGGRPVSWSGAMHRADRPNAVYEMLEKAAPLLARGGRPQTTCRSLTAEMDLKNPFVFTDCESAKCIRDIDKAEQIRIYSDPSFRAAVKAELDSGRKTFSASWRDFIVQHVHTPSLERYLRRTVREIAAERGKDEFDTLIDLALEDDLELRYVGGLRNTDKAALKTHIDDPRVLLGMADGGAHFDMLFECSYATYLLGFWVREQKAMPLERAIHRMTAEPAQFFDLPDRGRLAPGLRGDVTVFDPATVGAPEKADEVRHDLPGGGMRLYAKARGIAHVIVNGEVVMDNGRHTGALPGRTGVQAA